MKYFKVLTVTIISMFFLQACNDDKATEPEKEKITIVDAAISNGSFSTLVAGLQATGIDAILSNTKISVGIDTVILD
ncbi:hypothetical protein H4J56_15235 [Colwellia sp. BRX8-4]|uniref:hypothetical protein n=2 Tax=Colwellia TaxID=28228 RepID=UPI0015F373B0|nr:MULTISPECIES: hypothetical protein [unclassified Colwellia]MBA6353692.1 hypothetical protein [Colwellia sp. BRX9-1]MBA6372775.1 hypothetical protein [Colwellia sp. BRX8-4]